MASRQLPILQPLLCTLRSLLKLTCTFFFFFHLSYSVIFGQLVFLVCTVGHACVRFDCCGRRLVDMVQVHIAHMRCPGTRPHLKGQRTNRRYMLEQMWLCQTNSRQLNYTHSVDSKKKDVTCCCGSELSALFGTTLIMGLHAGSPACKPLYIGPPGPSAMGG